MLYGIHVARRLTGNHKLFALTVSINQNYFRFPCFYLHTSTQNRNRLSPRTFAYKSRSRIYINSTTCYTIYCVGSSTCANIFHTHRKKRGLINLVPSNQKYTTRLSTQFYLQVVQHLTRITTAAQWFKNIYLALHKRDIYHLKLLFQHRKTHDKTVSIFISFFSAGKYLSFHFLSNIIFTCPRNELFPE